jgi:transposase-like protein
MNPMKKILATVVTAAVVGAGGVAVASAASPAPTTPSTASAAATKPATQHSGVRKQLRKLGFDTAAKTIGLSPADLLKAMKGGHSIADVAAAHHVSAATVESAVTSALDTAIQQAATNGRITDAQATKIEAVVAKRVPKLVEAKPGQIIRRAAVHGAVAVSAKAIGVTPDSLRQSLASGQSVAQVATAHDVAPQTVVTALVNAGNARIDKLVANHRLSTTRAARLKARLPQLAQRFVNRTGGAGSAKAAAAA